MATVEAAARENGAAIEALGPQGIAVFPGDDEFTPLWRQLAGARAVRTFALQRAAEVRADAQWQGDALGDASAHPAGMMAATLRMAGQHNLKNALAATACALAAGVPLDAVARGLASLRAGEGPLAAAPVAARRAYADAGRRQLQRQPGFGARSDRRARVAGRPALAAARRHGRGRRAGRRPSMPRSAATPASAASNRSGRWARPARMRPRAFGTAARHFATVDALLAALPERRPRPRCWSRARASCAWSVSCRH